MDFFLALIFSILLWIGCAYWGKLFNSRFKLNIFQHSLCFVVTLITCICLYSVFKLNDIYYTIKKTENLVVQELSASISTLQSNAKKVELAEIKQILFQLLQEEMEKKYPFVTRFLYTNEIVKAIDKVDFAEGSTGLDMADIIQTAITPFTGVLLNKVKVYRNRVFFIILFFQLIVFAMSTYYAYNNSKRTIYTSYDFNSDEYL